MPSPPDVVRLWARAGAFLLYGLLFGASLLDPRLWWCAWLALFSLGYALHAAQSVREVLAGTLLGGLTARFLAFHWLFDMISSTLPWSLAERLGVLAGCYVAWGVPSALAITVVYALVGRRIGPWAWLPAAWCAGEVARFYVTRTALDDWLVSQWQVDPVLRSVGHLGWWTSLVLCVGVAAAAGQALAARRPVLAAPLGIWTLVLACLPPLPTHGNRVLDGVAVVATDSPVALPDRRPAGVTPSLVVWPEDIFPHRPTVPEGEHREPLGLPALLPGGEAEHLVGLEAMWPTAGLQNRVFVVGADGEVQRSRGKFLLFPIHETQWLGVGRDSYRPGRAPPLLRAGGIDTIPLICGEVMSRDLALRGRAAGGDLLVAPSRDNVLPTGTARVQALAVLALRSAELNVPAVRSSMHGDASIIGADGRLLAHSRTQGRHLLTWAPTAGAQQHPFRSDDADPSVAVLHSRRDTALRLPCPDGRCSHHVLEDFECEDQRAASVVVSGHSLPPHFAGHSPAALAAAVRCFEPDVVVVNTCFGATSTLLAELASTGALVIAAPAALPQPGFRFGDAFFRAGDARSRAAAVQAPSGVSAYRGAVDLAELSRAQRRIEAARPQERRAALVGLEPPLIAASLAGGRVLFPTAAAALRLHGLELDSSLRARMVRARQHLRSTTGPVAQDIHPRRQRP